ncbi:SMP-30/gluconolactonase/LRE family protein [Catellatospora sichuanensis]|uniref:SMP-30/gluconolactonase/LRE family protein n=1 Tax=Catellatospora sichuanensis TaxID=1969805 RepID=UPI001642F2E4|nr:SMP-30/gluconolactonase/LRE family protein [Catellatospora sichuanensis]
MDVISTEAYQLGECPRIDPRTGELLWVDIPAGRLHRGRWHGATLAGTAEHPVGAHIGAVAPVAGDGTGWVVAADRGFAHVAADGTVRPLGRTMPDGDTPPTAVITAPGTRMNDGACDPAGRFLAGSRILPGTAPGSGALYRLDPHTTVSTVLTGVGCSNGIGWNAGATAMYYIDSLARRLDVFDYDPATGAATGRRELAAFDDGSPDGLCVDDEGCVWVAVWDAWCVRRFTATGRLLTTLDLPVPRPTAVCLVGTALVVTTAWSGLDPAALAEAPLSGRIFAVDVGVTGPAATAWAGDLGELS